VGVLVDPRRLDFDGLDEHLPRPTTEDLGQRIIDPRAGRWQRLRVGGLP